MSRKVNVETENTAIFNDPRYQPNIRRSQTKVKGKARIKQFDHLKGDPVPSMATHIRNMAEHKFLPMQIAAKKTMPAFRKRINANGNVVTRQVRTSYYATLTAESRVELRLFLRKHNQESTFDVLVKQLRPGDVYTVERETPLVIKNRTYRFDSFYMKNSMFKNVIHKEL